jgi:hypothetical protein
MFRTPPKYFGIRDPGCLAIVSQHTTIAFLIGAPVHSGNPVYQSSLIYWGIPVYWGIIYYVVAEATTSEQECTGHHIDVPQYIPGLKQAVSIQ